MAFVFVSPESMYVAATDVFSVGSAVAAANQAAVGATTGVLTAAEDEVSAAIAALISAHGAEYQQIAARVAAFHDQFAQGAVFTEFPPLVGRVG